MFSKSTKKGKAVVKRKAIVVEREAWSKSRCITENIGEIGIHLAELPLHIVVHVRHVVVESKTTQAIC